jgi:hypothetical protein
VHRDRLWKVPRQQPADGDLLVAVRAFGTQTTPNAWPVDLVASRRRRPVKRGSDAECRLEGISADGGEAVVALHHVGTPFPELVLGELGGALRFRVDVPPALRDRPRAAQLGFGQTGGLLRVEEPAPQRPTLAAGGPVRAGQRRAVPGRSPLGSSTGNAAYWPLALLTLTVRAMFGTVSVRGVQLVHRDLLGNGLREEEVRDTVGCDQGRPCGAQGGDGADEEACRDRLVPSVRRAVGVPDGAGNLPAVAGLVALLASPGADGPRVLGP